MSKQIFLKMQPITEQYMVLDSHRCIECRAELFIVEQEKDYICKVCDIEYINDMPSNVGYEEEWAGNTNVIDSKNGSSAG